MRLERQPMANVEDTPDWPARAQEPVPVAAPPASAEADPSRAAGLPPVEQLDESSDYTGFLAPGVGEDLRRLALHKLFHLPSFNVTDELDDYAEDFTDHVPLGDLITHELRGALERRSTQADKSTDGPARQDGAPTHAGLPADEQDTASDPTLMTGDQPTADLGSREPTAAGATSAPAKSDPEPTTT
jgi:hypothetical protein